MHKNYVMSRKLIAPIQIMYVIFLRGGMQWSLLTYSCVWEFFLLQLQLFTYNWSFCEYTWSLFSYSKKVRLISSWTDCKHRCSTVSTKATNCTVVSEITTQLIQKRFYGAILILPRWRLISMRFSGVIFTPEAPSRVFSTKHAAEFREQFFGVKNCRVMNYPAPN